MAVADPVLPPVFCRDDALAAGLTPRQADLRVSRGRWRSLRRGAYCLPERWEAADARERHVLLARAVLLTLDGTHVISHTSGAAVHGLPLPFSPTPVWTTTPSDGCTRYRDGLVVMAASLLGDVVRRERLAVTSAGRTVADCLRHLKTVDAVAIADAAVRRRSGVWPEVLATLERCEGWPYADVARRRLLLVDGRRESPVESWSYVAMDRRGLPMPEPQVTLLDERGRAVGRVDAWWDDCAVVGEADGLTKYGVGVGLTPEEAVRAVVKEKRREDAVRATGAHVARWGTVDLHDEARWADWMRRQLTLGDRRRFRGSVIRTPPLAHRSALCSP